MIKNIKNKLNNFRNWMTNTKEEKLMSKVFKAGAIVSLISTPLQAAKLNTDLTLDTAVGGLAETFFTIAKYVGVPIAIVSIFTFILSLFNPDVMDKKVQSFIALIIGVALIGLEAIVKQIGIIF